MLELSYKSYLDKVHGGWIGKCIGGAIGALQENNKSLMDYTMDNVFPQKIPPNDDLDLQVLYLQEVLERKGSRFTAADIAEAFTKYNLCLANEYSVAIKNMELGIEPPLSGSFNNHFFNHSMGCPIRSEIWGFISPGNPEVAAHYAYMDGIVDHEGESVYGEQFYASLEAESFFENDIITLIGHGLKYVPHETELYGCIHFVMDLHERGIEWIAARGKLVRRFGSSDASYSVINIGITIMALLYGEGDFTKTMLTAVNSGYDTDCTAATAGAILGVILGAGQIPDFWLDKIGEDVVIGTVDIQRYSDKMIDLAKDTCSAGLSLSRDGVTSVMFTDVPADVKPSLPLPISDQPMEITVRYEGLPSIGYGEKKTVEFTVFNHSDEDQICTMTVEPPETLLSSRKEIELRISGKTPFCFSVDFEVKHDLPALPQRNIIVAKITKAGKTMVEKSFGLSGAARMKLIGPFWDNYDTTQFESDPYDGKMPHTLHAMFNGFVNLDKPYINESFADLDQLEGEYVNFHEDKMTPDTFIQYKGPCCIYLVHEIVCPEDRDDVHLLIGNEAPYKVWINEELVIEGRDCAMWMPYNDSAVIKLKSGINRVIMKLLRIGKTADFSYLLRSEKSKMHMFVDLESMVTSTADQPFVMAL